MWRPVSEDTGCRILKRESAEEKMKNAKTQIRRRSTVALQGRIEWRSAWIRIVTAVFLGLVVPLNYGCRPSSEASPSGERTESEVDSSSDMGIEVKGLRLSASGYMLDFRFRVTDPDRAAGFFGKGIDTYLIDPESGARLIVPRPPKVGALRQNTDPPIQGRIYFVMFANPGRFIQSGKKVTVVMGETEIRDIMVQ